MLDRILNVLTSAETWTNIGVFLVGWALAELRAWVAGRLTLRRWRVESERTAVQDMTPGLDRGTRSLLDALNRWNPDLGNDEPTYEIVSVAKREAIRRALRAQRDEIEQRFWVESKIGRPPPWDDFGRPLPPASEGDA